MVDAIDQLRLAKAKADEMARDRDNYSGYVADRQEHGGWSAADVEDYRAEVKRIMATGTEDEKSAAREFWAHKAAYAYATGSKARIRASIEAEKREAA